MLVNNPLLGLYVSPVSVSTPCVPVAPSTNAMYVVSSVLLLALTVTLVASVAVAAFPVQLPELPLVLPVTFPVKLPVTDVTVNSPVLGLYVNPVSVSIPCVPVAPSTNVINVVSLVLLFAVTVILVASVAVDAFPVIGPENPVAVTVPSTSSFVLGAVVPIPTFPFAITRILSVPSVSIFTCPSLPVSTVSTVVFPSVIESVDIEFQDNAPLPSVLKY